MYEKSENGWKCFSPLLLWGIYKFSKIFPLIMQSRKAKPTYIMRVSDICKSWSLAVTTEVMSVDVRAMQYVVSRKSILFFHSLVYMLPGLFNCIFDYAVPCYIELMLFQCASFSQNSLEKIYYIHSSEQNITFEWANESKKTCYHSLQACSVVYLSFRCLR